MRMVPGWVVGAAGAAVVASAFFLGGRLAASDVTPATMMAAEAAPGFQLECEPGQRAVLRQSEATIAGRLPVASMACVSELAAPMGYMRRAGNLQPAVYRPTAAPLSTSVQRTSTARAPVVKKRSTGRSVAIIAGSTAAGAVIGGVAKGKKGAVIGGIAGGVAATIWDQVTRRKR